jgi:hypothetical protein
MLRRIPGDVWVASAAACGIAAAILLETGSVLFVGMYCAVCGYVLIATFTKRTE